jgi:hypothetical protein
MMYCKPRKLGDNVATPAGFEEPNSQGRMRAAMRFSGFRSNGANAAGKPAIDFICRGPK